jgi:DNA-binding transcriptional MerR regulator
LTNIIRKAAAMNAKPLEVESGGTWSISELAGEFDVTPRAIRFYEDQGLISPSRRGQTRIYSARDRTRLKLILRGKRLGFSLGEVADIIDLYDSDPGEVAQLEFFIDKISQQKKALEQQQEDIEITLAELNAVELNCRTRLKSLTKS